MAQRFYCSNIPIDDQNLLVGFVSDHISLASFGCAIRNTKLYSTFTFL
jgi:hypothetical protein